MQSRLALAACPADHGERSRLVAEPCQQERPGEERHVALARGRLERVEKRLGLGPPTESGEDQTEQPGGERQPSVCSPLERSYRPLILALRGVTPAQPVIGDGHRGIELASRTEKPQGRLQIARAEVGRGGGRVYDRRERIALDSPLCRGDCRRRATGLEVMEREPDVGQRLADAELEASRK